MGTELSPHIAIYIVWAVWGASWIAASVWANRTVNRPPARRELGYRILQLIAFVLLLGVVRKAHPEHTSPIDFLIAPLWNSSSALKWAMVALAVLGFGFAWWARLYLGRLWSASITRKEGHRVVDSGPYAIVRHPIYTGMLTAAIGTAAVASTLHALLGAVLLTASFWIKARQEERFLREELGPQDYDAYRRRVPMLVPFGPKSA